MESGAAPPAAAKGRLRREREAAALAARARQLFGGENCQGWCCRWWQRRNLRLQQQRGCCIFDYLAMLLDCDNEGAWLLFPRVAI